MPAISAKIKEINSKIVIGTGKKRILTITDYNYSTFFKDIFQKYPHILKYIEVDELNILSKTIFDSESKPLDFPRNCEVNIHQTGSEIKKFYVNKSGLRVFSKETKKARPSLITGLELDDLKDDIPSDSEFLEFDTESVDAVDIDLPESNEDKPKKIEKRKKNSMVMELSDLSYAVQSIVEDKELEDIDLSNLKGSDEHERNDSELTMFDGKNPKFMDKIESPKVDPVKTEVRMILQFLENGGEYDIAVGKHLRALHGDVKKGSDLDLLVKYLDSGKDITKAILSQLRSEFDIPNPSPEDPEVFSKAEKESIFR